MVPRMAERRHGRRNSLAPIGGELGRHHGNLHGLFLKQRHALRAPKHSRSSSGGHEGERAGIDFLFLSISRRRR
jgi:hypothetical protein